MDKVEVSREKTIVRTSVIGIVANVFLAVVSKPITSAQLDAEQKRLLNAMKSDTTLYMMQVKSILSLQEYF